MMKAKHYIDGLEVKEEYVNRLINAALTDEQVATIATERSTDKEILNSPVIARIFASYIVASDLAIAKHYLGSLKIDAETLGFDYTVEYVKE